MGYKLTVLLLPELGRSVSRLLSKRNYSRNLFYMHCKHYTVPKQSLLTQLCMQLSVLFIVLLAACTASWAARYIDLYYKLVQPKGLMIMYAFCWPRSALVLPETAEWFCGEAFDRDGQTQSRASGKLTPGVLWPTDQLYWPNMSDSRFKSLWTLHWQPLQIVSEIFMKSVQMSSSCHRNMESMWQQDASIFTSTFKGSRGSMSCSWNMFTFSQQWKGQDP